MNKLKYLLSVTVLLSLLVGCSESSHYYISMTTTHATDQEFIFTSNTYMYDLTSKKLKKVSSEPYESQYPLSTYDYKNNKVYYSGSDNKEYGNSYIKQYGLSTHKTSKFIDYVDAINDIRILDDHKMFIVGRLKKVKKNTMVPSIYNTKTHKINYLNWNQDSFATCTNYNPDTQELIIPHYSMSLSYKLTDDYNNGIIKNEVDSYAPITFTVVKKNKTEDVFKLNHKQLDSTYIDKDYIYYVTDKQTSITNFDLVRYDRHTKEKKKLLDGKCGYYSMNIVTVLDNIIYFIGQKSEVYELVELDMNTNEQTVIYQSKTQEAINNAQFYKK